MIAWNVYLDGKIIDTVWFTKNCDKEYVFNSLLDDGFDTQISVELA